MDRFAYPEFQRGGCRRTQRPCEVRAPSHVVPQFAPHVVGGATVPVALVETFLQRIVQASFLADLLQAAPDRVDVNRAGPDQVPAEPGNAGAAASARARIARAEPESPVDPRSSHVDELG